MQPIVCNFMNVLLRKICKIIYLLLSLTGCGIGSSDNYITTNQAIEVVEVCNRRFLRTDQGVYLINEDYVATLTQKLAGTHLVGNDCEYEVYLNSVTQR